MVRVAIKGVLRFNFITCVRQRRVRNFSPCSSVTLIGETLATPEALDEQALVEAAQADPARFLDLY